jgi:hypothetical protein
VSDLLYTIDLVTLAVRPQTDLVEVLEFLGGGSTCKSIEEIGVDVELFAGVVDFVEDGGRVGGKITCVCLWSVSVAITATEMEEWRTLKKYSSRPSDVEGALPLLPS